MNQREKILAAIVALSIVVSGGVYGVKHVVSWFQEKNDKIAELTETVKAKKTIVQRGTVARQTLDVYAERALPSDAVLASSRYRAWLHDWVEKVGIKKEDVKYVFGRRAKDVYDKFTFSVVCEGDLVQMTQLLFDFYSTDYLHRIKHMSAKPIKGNQLTLAFSIEALALLDGVKDKELIEMAADRLAFDDVEKYIAGIVNRNPYSPANIAPKFASSGHETGYLNQVMSFRPEAKDPDNDQVSYRLGEHQLEGLTIDESSGRIEWTPDEKGEFEILVFAIDNGLPSKETPQKITLEVTDPPPPKEPEPSPPSFDIAKFTFVTGIVEVNDRPQAWLTDRTAGKLMKLYEGDSFEVGQFKGKIVRIHDRRVEIQCEDALLSVDYGHSISDGTVLSQESEL